MEKSVKKVKEESSSSDEEDDRLKEALDPNMFNKNATSMIRETTKSVKSTSYKDNILNVTPEFQSYVGKHLSDMIDKNIKEHDGKQFDIDASRSGGIKLFAVSSEILTEENFCEYYHPHVDQSARKKRKHSRKCDDENQMTEMEKIRSVAVSPEWVLEKHGVRGWSKPKGKEIKVKKNTAGNLEIVASPFVSE